MSLRLKNVFAVFLLICVVISVLEAGSYGLYQSLYGKPFSYRFLEQQMETITHKYDQTEAGNNPFSAENRAYIIHPYLGHIYNTPYYGTRKMDDKPLLTPYGLQGEEDPLAASKDPNVAIIAVTGGSVSDRLFRYNRALLHKGLSKLPVFKGKRIVIIALGREMYKQPQQLISVVYYLAQGGRLDMLINIDGFNDLQRPIKHKEINGIYPLFPDFWAPHLSLFYGNSRNGAPEDIILVQRLRYYLARLAKPLSLSITVSTLWSMADAYIQQQVIEMEKRYTAVSVNAKNHRYDLQGPRVWQNKTRDEVAKFAIDAWEISSTQLQYLSKANGFLYFQFIQPNQYVPGSKTPSEEEVKLFKDRVLTFVPYYRDLEKRMPGMRAKGIHIYSLVDIFKNVKETTYSDSCCHLNELGNQIMGDIILKEITAALKEQKPTKAP